MAQQPPSYIVANILKRVPNIPVEGAELLPHINLNLSAIAISVLGSSSRCLVAAAVPTTEAFF